MLRPEFEKNILKNVSWNLSSLNKKGFTYAKTDVELSALKSVVVTLGEEFVVEKNNGSSFKWKIILIRKGDENGG